MPNINIVKNWPKRGKKRGVKNRWISDILGVLGREPGHRPGRDDRVIPLK